MSASDPSNASTSAAPAAAPSASARPGHSGSKPPSRGGRSLAGLALVLALVALIGVAFGGWRLWQLEHHAHADTRALHDAQDKLHKLTGQVEDVASQQQSMHQQVQQAVQQMQGVDGQVQGLSERSRSLENAVASLTARAQSGRDAMRLDEAGMLLRMAGERYRLFHDATGAIKAYRMADQVMANVDDPAYASVRQSIELERKALAATQPELRQADLEALARMRGDVASWPLKSTQTGTKAAGTGFWSRLGQAFSGLVRVSRSTDDLASGQRDLARSLTELDLAQAQAARLDWNETGFVQALKRADARIKRYFDLQAAPVKQARVQIRQWLSRSEGSAPDLGQALQQLHNLRAVHDIAAPSDTSAPENKSAKPAKGTQR
ncbi:uroporphyrinogen-III C-methyltransferase [Oleiagrimonas sp.]|jgi:uroporphyrin-3 C-methyltransferase|uniref:uroporphyrinogen-III C-methyltransferase n=1 Tax=Oleiagrimonas sp. TaxID=2010330 RepID=UPI00260382B4|nr:uroporphyrinogen-III C-methyltransferase [Oleiagrimonas sp.]MDA3913342.1 uroporphyrinogen-III C-methyltransferase [Oleiagrimonas sp.]